jgi:adenylate cyclase
MWVVREGIRGAGAAVLFDGLCQRLVIAGVPLWRAFVGMPTLHPQWGGYSYTWRRDLNAIEPSQFGRGDEYEQILLNSPFGYLIRQMENSAQEGDPWLHLRRRLTGSEARQDFSILKEIAAAGASDYFAEVVRFGADGDPSHGTGIGYSFATDRPAGFRDDDLALLQAVLPVVSLAMKTHGGHTIPPVFWKLIWAATPAGAFMPGRWNAVRSRVSALCCGTPISAASRRSPTRRRGSLSSNCSTRSSRRLPLHCARAAAKC